MSRAPQNVLRRFLAAAAAGAIIVLAAACGGDEPADPAPPEAPAAEEAELDEFGFPVNAHVQPELGAVPEGIELDAREGTPPPAGARGSLEELAGAANCELQLDLPDEGNDHFGDDATDVPYKTSPPTSGDHYAGNEPASGALADGAYAETPPLTRAVHGLEHGRVQIQYSPDLAEADQLAVKGVFDADPAGISLFPNSEMPYEVAATAWTRLIGCETYEGEATLAALEAFRDEFRGRGPEPVPLEL